MCRPPCAPVCSRQPQKVRNRSPQLGAKTLAEDMCGPPLDCLSAAGGAYAFYMPMRSSLQQGTQTFPGRTCMMCWFDMHSCCRAWGMPVKQLQEQHQAGIPAGTTDSACVSGLSVCTLVAIMCSWRAGQAMIPFSLQQPAGPAQAPQVQSPIRPLAANVLVWQSVLIAHDDSAQVLTALAGAQDRS